MTYGENPNVFLELASNMPCTEEIVTEINTTEVNKRDLYFGRATILLIFINFF